MKVTHLQKAIIKHGNVYSGEWIELKEMTTREFKNKKAAYYDLIKPSLVVVSIHDKPVYSIGSRFYTGIRFDNGEVWQYIKGWIGKVPTESYNTAKKPDNATRGIFYSDLPKQFNIGGDELCSRHLWE